eukprot:Rhum_TRINITY_DN15190_c9_g1::Rhum_TRINITY_DN15190_c9_g1_i1::g.141999::m.141999
MTKKPAHAAAAVGGSGSSSIAAFVLQRRRRGLALLRNAPPLAEEAIVSDEEGEEEVDAGISELPSGAASAALVMRSYEQARRVLVTHVHPIDQVVFSPNGRWFLTVCSATGCVKFWCCRTLELRGCVTLGRAECTRAAVNATGSMVAWCTPRSLCAMQVTREGHPIWNTGQVLVRWTSTPQTDGPPVVAFGGHHVACNTSAAKNAALIVCKVQCLGVPVPLSMLDDSSLPRDRSNWIRFRPMLVSGISPATLAWSVSHETHAVLAAVASGAIHLMKFPLPSKRFTTTRTRVEVKADSVTFARLTLKVATLHSFFFAKEAPVLYATSGTDGAPLAVHVTLPSSGAPYTAVRVVGSLCFAEAKERAATPKKRPRGKGRGRRRVVLSESSDEGEGGAASPLRVSVSALASNSKIKEGAVMTSDCTRFMRLRGSGFRRSKKPPVEEVFLTTLCRRGLLHLLLWRAGVGSAYYAFDTSGAACWATGFADPDGAEPKQLLPHPRLPRVLTVATRGGEARHYDVRERGTKLRLLGVNTWHAAGGSPLVHYGTGGACFCATDHTGTLTMFTNRCLRGGAAHEEMLTARTQQFFTSEMELLPPEITNTVLSTFLSLEAAGPQLREGETEAVERVGGGLLQLRAEAVGACIDQPSPDTEDTLLFAIATAEADAVEDVASSQAGVESSQADTASDAANDSDSDDSSDASTEPDTSSSDGEVPSAEEMAELMAAIAQAEAAEAVEEQQPVQQEPSLTLEPSLLASMAFSDDEASVLQVSDGTSYQEETSDSEQEAGGRSSLAMLARAAWSRRDDGGRRRRGTPSSSSASSGSESDSSLAAAPKQPYQMNVTELKRHLEREGVEVPPSVRGEDRRKQLLNAANSHIFKTFGIDGSRPQRAGNYASRAAELDLRLLCRQRGLDDTGTRSALATRLKQHDVSTNAEHAKFIAKLPQLTVPQLKEALQECGASALAGANKAALVEQLQNRKEAAHNKWSDTKAIVEYDKVSLTDLRALCAERSFNGVGTKDEVVARLEYAQKLDAEHFPALRKECIMKAAPVPKTKSEAVSYLVAAREHPPTPPSPSSSSSSAASSSSDDESSSRSDSEPKCEADLQAHCVARKIPSTGKRPQLQARLDYYAELFCMNRRTRNDRCRKAGLLAESWHALVAVREKLPVAPADLSHIGRCALCRERGLSFAGTRDRIVARLEAYDGYMKLSRNELLAQARQAGLQGGSTKASLATALTEDWEAEDSTSSSASVSQETDEESGSSGGESSDESTSSGEPEVDAGLLRLTHGLQLRQLKIMCETPNMPKAYVKTFKELLEKRQALEASREKEEEEEEEDEEEDSATEKEETKTPVRTPKKRAWEYDSDDAPAPAAVVRSAKRARVGDEASESEPETEPGPESARARGAKKAQTPVASGGASDDSSDDVVLRRPRKTRVPAAETPRRVPVKEATLASLIDVCQAAEFPEEFKTHLLESLESARNASRAARQKASEKAAQRRLAKMNAPSTSPSPVDDALQPSMSVVSARPSAAGRSIELVAPKVYEDAKLETLAKVYRELPLNELCDLCSTVGIKADAYRRKATIVHQLVDHAQRTGFQLRAPPSPAAAPTGQDIDTMSLMDLREALSDMGCDATGSRDTLRTRLQREKDAAAAYGRAARAPHPCEAKFATMTLDELKRLAEKKSMPVHEPRELLVLRLSTFEVVDQQVNRRLSEIDPACLRWACERLQLPSDGTIRDLTRRLDNTRQSVLKVQPKRGPSRPASAPQPNPAIMSPPPPPPRRVQTARTAAPVAPPPTPPAMPAAAPKPDAALLPIEHPVDKRYGELDGTEVRRLAAQKGMPSGESMGCVVRRLATYEVLDQLDPNSADPATVARLVWGCRRLFLSHAGNARDLRRRLDHARLVPLAVPTSKPPETQTHAGHTRPWPFNVQPPARPRPS